MASLEETNLLLRSAPQGEFDLQEVGQLLDDKGFNGAAAVLWAADAKNTSTLVDTSESGSSRKMSDIHKNAVAMAKMYQAAADAETVVVVATGNTARSRLITR